MLWTLAKLMCLGQPSSKFGKDPLLSDLNLHEHVVIILNMMRGGLRTERLATVYVNSFPRRGRRALHEDK